MRGLVVAFLLGSVAVAAVLATTALAAGVLAEASGWHGLRLAVGPVLLVAFERAGQTTATTFGPGLLAIVILAGALNALGAALLRRRG